MVVAYRTLMCAQYPSFKQGGYSVAMGQQIVANFCRLAHHVMGISKSEVDPVFLDTGLGDNT